MNGLSPPERRFGEIQTTPRPSSAVEPLSNAIDDGIYQLDAEGRFVAVNDAVVELTGYAREELLGEHVSVLFDEEDVSAVEQEIERLSTTPTERGELLDLTVQTVEGNPIRCEVRVSLLEAGDSVRGTVGTVRDITERKRSEQRVSEREQKLEARSAAMERSIDGMAILDENAEYVSVNQAHADIYGYDDPEALLGESWGLCYDDEEIERLEGAAMPALSAEGRWRGEATGTRKDGSTFPQELSLTMLDDGRYVCVVRDVGDRKRMEDELQTTREKYQRLVERNSVGIYIIQNGEVKYANSRFAEIFGYSPEEMVGTPAAECVAEHERERIAEQFRRRERGDIESLRYEVTGKRKDGGPVEVEVHGGVIEYEGEPAIMGALIDITDRKKREQDLYETKERLRAIFDGTYEYIGLLEPDGTVLEANRASLKWDGATRENTIGVPVWEAPWFANTPGVPDKLRQAVARAAEGGFVRQEFPLQDASGEVTWFDFSLYPIQDENGEVVYLVPEGRAIDERKQRERELRETTEQLEVATSAADVGLWTWDIQENVVTADEYLAETYGTDPEAAAVGAPMEAFYEPIHEDDEDETWEQLMRAVEETGELEAEYRVRDAEGDVRWVLARGEVEYDDGEPVRLNGAVSDITERKRRERRAHFFEELERELQPLSDPDEIMATAAWTLGEHLGVDRCAYADVEGDEDHFVITGDYAPGAPQASWAGGPSPTSGTRRSG